MQNNPQNQHHVMDFSFQNYHFSINPLRVYTSLISLIISGFFFINKPLAIAKDVYFIDRYFICLALGLLVVLILLRYKNFYSKQPLKRNNIRDVSIVIIAIAVLIPKLLLILSDKGCFTWILAVEFCVTWPLFVPYGWLYCSDPNIPSGITDISNNKGIPQNGGPSDPKGSQVPLEAEKKTKKRRYSSYTASDISNNKGITQNGGPSEPKNTPPKWARPYGEKEKAYSKWFWRTNGEKDEIFHDQMDADDTAREAASELNAMNLMDLRAVRKIYRENPTKANLEAYVNEKCVYEMQTELNKVRLMKTLDANEAKSQALVDKIELTRP